MDGYGWLRGEWVNLLFCCYKKNILCNSSINYPYLEPMMHVYTFMIEEVISGH